VKSAVHAIIEIDDSEYNYSRSENFARKRDRKYLDSAESDDVIGALAGRFPSMAVIEAKILHC